MAFHGSNHGNTAENPQSGSFSTYGGEYNFGNTFRTADITGLSDREAMILIALAANDVRASLESPWQGKYDIKNIPSTWDTTTVRNILNAAQGRAYTYYPHGRSEFNVGTTSEGHMNSGGLFNYSNTPHPSYSAHRNSDKTNTHLNTSGWRSAEARDITTSDLGTDYGSRQAILNALNSRTLLQDYRPYSGSVHKSGHGNHSNSKRIFKTNIEKFDGDACDILKKVNVVSFNYNPKTFPEGDPNIKHYGFIADDTDEILSTLYHDRMDLMNCVGILIKANQELQDKVNKLEEKINK